MDDLIYRLGCSLPGEHEPGEMTHWKYLDILFGKPTPPSYACYLNGHERGCGDLPTVAAFPGRPFLLPCKASWQPRGTKEALVAQKEG